MERLDQYVNEL